MQKKEKKKKWGCGSWPAISTLVLRTSSSRSFVLSSGAARQTWTMLPPSFNREATFSWQNFKTSHSCPVQMALFWTLTFDILIAAYRVWHVVLFCSFSEHPQSCFLMNLLGCPLWEDWHPSWMFSASEQSFSL